MSPNQENFEKLEAFIDGALDPFARAEVERQLAANPQLRKMVAELSMTRELLRGLPRAKAPVELMETFQGSLEREALLGESSPTEPAGVVLRINRWPQFMSVAAILLLAVGLAMVVYKVLPAQRRPNQVASSQVPPTSGEAPGEMKDGRDTAAVAATPPPPPRADHHGFAGGRNVAGEGLKEDGTHLGMELAKGGASGLDGATQVARKGGSDDQNRNAPRMNDALAKQVQEKTDTAGSGGGDAGSDRRGRDATASLRAAQRQVTQATESLGQKVGGGGLGAEALDAPPATAMSAKQLPGKFAEAALQQQQLEQPQQDRPELLLVSARNPQVARQDVSEFLAKNKIMFIALAAADSGQSASTFNYGANLRLSNNNNEANYSAAPTTSGSIVNSAGGSQAGFGRASAAPVQQGNGVGNNGALAGRDGYGNFGANYANNAAAGARGGANNDVNIDRSAASPATPSNSTSNSNTGYAQNGNVERSQSTPAQAPAGEPQRAYRQSAQQQRSLDRNNDNNDNNTAVTLNTATTQAGVAVIEQGPVTYSFNGGAYRALLTTRQQAELNQYLSRRGDQWAEQRETPPELYARLQALDSLALQDGAQRAPAASVAKTETLEELNDKTKKPAEKPDAEAEVRMKSEARPQEQGQANAQALGAAAPDVRLRQQAEFQVRARGGQVMAESAKAAEVNDQVRSQPGREEILPPPAQDTSVRGGVRQGLGDEVSLRRAAGGNGSAPAVISPGPASQLSRDLDANRDKADNQAALAEETHEVIIVFNDQPANLPSVLSAAQPTSQPATAPATATTQRAAPAAPAANPAPRDGRVDKP